MLALAALAMGVGCGAMGAWQLHSSMQSRAQLRLQSGAELAVQALEQRLAVYADVLEQLSSSLSGSVHESPQLFAQQAHHALSQVRLHGLQALSLTRVSEPNPYVDAGEPPFHFETSAVWPYKGNEMLKGHDVRPAAAVWQSLQSAWRSRSMAVSGAYHLHQVSGSPLGVLLRRPVFGPQSSQGEEPVPQLQGIVNATVRLSDFALGLVPANVYPHVALKIQDLGPVQTSGAAGAGPMVEKTLYTGSIWVANTEDADFAAALPLERRLHVYDRVWLLQFKSAIGSTAWLEKTMPWAVLALGSLLGLLAAFGISGWWQSRFSWLRRIRSSKQAHKQSDARFHAMCEQAALGVVEVDLDSRGILKVNAHYCRLTGHAEQELVSHNVLEMLVPEDRAGCASLMDTVNLQQFPHGSGSSACVPVMAASSGWS